MTKGKTSLRFVAGFVLGIAAAGLAWQLNRSEPEQRLGRRHLVEYCKLFVNDGELRGGAGGALGWRCLDRSDPSFVLTVGLFDINNFCRNRFRKTPFATITDLRAADGWTCSTEERAKREKTVAITVDSDFPATGKRPRDGGVIPIVDSPNRYLDAEGRMNLRRRATIRAFCVEPLNEAGAPPFMYGVITPTLQRGFIRSDFTATPNRSLPLPRCQA